MVDAGAFTFGDQGTVEGKFRGRNVRRCSHYPKGDLAEPFGRPTPKLGPSHPTSDEGRSRGRVRKQVGVVRDPGLSRRLSLIHI